MLAPRRSILLLAAFSFLAAGFARAQIRSEGYIDTAFGSACLTNLVTAEATRALAVQPNDHVLVGGTFNSSVACANAIVRLKPTGARDTTFSSLFISGDWVNAIAVQPDGKILVAGFLRNGASSFAVARLNTNGTLDTTFSRVVNGANFIMTSLALQPDGRVVVAGYEYSTATNSVTIGHVVRLNTNGTVDTSFAAGLTPQTTLGQGFSVATLQSGKVIVGGTFKGFSANGVQFTRDGLIRLLADGTVDAPFNPFISNSDIRAVLVQPDDKILVAGLFRVEGADRMLMRLNNDGTRDTSFAMLDSTGGSFGVSLLRQPDGKLLFGHNFGVIRLLTNGAVDSTFGPRNDALGLGTAASLPTALARNSEGNIYVSAVVVRVNNTRRQAVARIFGTIPPPPVIVQQPASQTVLAGTNVTLSIVATGAPPVLYQWRKNGKALTGATNDTLTLEDVDSTDTGDFTVVASSLGSSVTSAVARLQVVFFVSPITVTVSAGGIVKPNYNGKELEIGRTYTMTAVPARGFLFTNWSGFETSANPVLTFVMQSNEVLFANFVPSPFIPVRGAYTGLFYDTNAPAHGTAGAVDLTLDDRGGFRGTVRMGKVRRKFSGKFSLDRVAVATIPATSTRPAISLSLELDTVLGWVNGEVTIGTNATPSTLSAFRKVFSSKSNPAPHAGRYHAVVPGADAMSPAPAGDGFVPLAVSTSGRVSGKGVLADGTSWSVVSATATNAWVPVYVSLYSGAGSIYGWLSVTNTGSNDVAGALWWTKPAGVRGALHPAGFSNVIATLGSRFTAVPKGTNVLNLPAGVAILDGGNLAESITNLFTLGIDNKITGNPALSLTLSGSKGTLTGSFTDPATARKRTVRGLVLPNQNQARGFFLGSDESGRVWVGE